MCAGCTGTCLDTLKLQRISALPVWLPSVSVFSSTLWPHLSCKQLGVKGRKERGMAGSPERGGCLREEEGGRSSVVHGAASSSSSARGRHGTCRKAEDRAGPTLPSELPQCPSLTALES